VLVADPAHPIDSQHVFEVLFRQAPGSSIVRDCRCPVAGTVIPVASVKGGAFFEELDPTQTPTAQYLAFYWTQMQAKQLEKLNVNELWVRFRGDFVLDVNNKAIDAQFVRAQLPTGQRPSGSAFGIEGGTFESWFWLGQKPSNTNQ
jgi:hypothetical protein